MKKSLFVIEIVHRVYDSSHSDLKAWGFTSYEKAEEYLFSKHWKKTTWCSGDIIYEKPVPEEYNDWYIAKIKEIYYWEN